MININLNKIYCHKIYRNIKGVTLIETMVAILILSIGLLGIAGLQAATAKYKINTWARSSAASMLSDLSERVRINPDAAGPIFSDAGTSPVSSYIINENWTAQQTASFTLTKNCETTACTSAERAVYDLKIWRQSVRNNMPQGSAIISGDRANGIDVTVMWFDKERTDKDFTLQAAPICSSNNSETGMAQQSCCPAVAAAPVGVRCARFSFVP